MSRRAVRARLACAIAALPFIALSPGHDRALSASAPSAPIPSAPSAPAPEPQQAAPGVRLAAFRAEPGSPEFGRPFQLEVRLRLAPGSALALSDTMIPADAVASAGKGTWVEAEAPGDSTDVTATYPVVAYLNGEIDLPGVELRIGATASGETTVFSLGTEEDPSAAPPLRDDELRRMVIPVGRLQVTPLRELTGAGDSIAPRAPADVLGRTWSAWLALAGVLAGVALLGAGWSVVARVRARAAASRGRAQGSNSRADALLELERIRSLGWHRQGRVAEFYAATTGVLRRFSEQREPDWGTGLTSSELLEKLQARWGGASTEKIGSVVPAAEWAKFGRYRPDADIAEADWAEVRDWIQRMPDEHR